MLTELLTIHMKIYRKFRYVRKQKTLQTFKMKGFGQI